MNIFRRFWDWINLDENDVEGGTTDYIVGNDEYGYSITIGGRAMWASSKESLRIAMRNGCVNDPK